MGYRSDVVLMAVFSNAEEREEVMAIYRMDPRVAEHKLEEMWRKVEFEDKPVALIYEAESIKWYDMYDDVQGLQHMYQVLQDFHEERGFHYAWLESRIGEDDADIEWALLSSETDEGYALQEIVYNSV
jgi:hypothetical protein